MLSYEYLPDQVKYFTRIREFEYKRPGPQDATPTIQPQAMLSLPLPINMPSDAYSEVIREFDQYEIGTSIDVIQGAYNSGNLPSLGEAVGVGLTGAAGLGVIASAAGLIKGAKSSIGDIIGLGVGGQVLLDYFSTIAGKSRNPHTSMIFDRMGMRHFSMNFLLAPRDEQQSRTLDSMLFYMRSKMHPSFMDGNAFVLNYPSMFTVEFAGFPQDRMGIPRVTDSFLKSMNVNASPQGQVFMKGGWPALLEVNLEFVELEAKTRDYFQNQGNATAGGPR